MSFTMASVKLLAAQEGTNRCPPLFLPTCFFFFAFMFVSQRLTPDLRFLLDHLFLQPFFWGWGGVGFTNTLLFELLFSVLLPFSYF